MDFKYTKSLKTMRFMRKMHSTPSKTARKSTNSKQSTIIFSFFFLKIKIECFAALIMLLYIITSCAFRNY